MGKLVIVPTHRVGKVAKLVERLVFREVDPDRWGDLARLFEGRGGPSFCWCMVWRATPLEVPKRDGKSRKAALRRRVRAGVPIGLLGYLDREPVMWCSIAPRSTYRRLGGTIDASDDRETVWSIACFFVARPFRRQGAMARLIEAAVDHARKRGATIIEAYPVDPGSPSYRFMGFTSTFKAAGFREIARAGTRRHVMHLRLTRAS